MIIRPNNMTSQDFQKQVNLITKMKRGFNQNISDIKSNNMTINNKKTDRQTMVNESLKMQSQIGAMKRPPKNQ